MKLRLLFVIFIAMAGVSVPTGAALAQDNSLNRARAAFDKAQALYAQGKYAEAATEFQAAYDARPFAQFLFNIGASYEKLREYDKAVTHYKKYLTEDPKAQDKAAVEKRITVLEKEAARIKAVPKPPGGTDPTTQPTVTPSKEVADLGDVTIRGLVVIESDPPGAYIYLDDKKKGPLSKTPWNGTLEGEHTIFIDRQGYKPVERAFAPDPNQLSVLIFTLAEQDYLGWVDIKSNIPGADIYINDKASGVYNKTPFSGNIKPGKTRFWITAEGYDEYTTEIDIVPGKTHEINANLSGAPVGYLNIRGRGIELATIYLDGKVLCERGPCRKPVREGSHTIAIKRKDHKTYKRRMDVQPKTETIIRAKMAKKPGRGDAIWAYVFAASFAGGGIYLGLQANGIEDDLKAERLGTPPVDSDDPRFTRGKFFAIGADAAYALAGVSFLTAVYYTFRDKGKPSTATSDVRAIALEPQVTPTYAGLGLGVSW